MSFKFVQMSDPQLGFYASRHPDTEGIDYEVKNLSKAISTYLEVPAIMFDKFQRTSF